MGGAFGPGDAEGAVGVGDGWQWGLAGGVAIGAAEEVFDAVGDAVVVVVAIEGAAGIVVGLPGGEGVREGELEVGAVDAQRGGEAAEGGGEFGGVEGATDGGGGDELVGAGGEAAEGGEGEVVDAEGTAAEGERAADGNLVAGGGRAEFKYEFAAASGHGGDVEAAADGERACGACGGSR